MIIYILYLRYILKVGIIIYIIILMVEVIRIHKNNTVRSLNLPNALADGLKIKVGDMVILRPVNSYSFIVERINPEAHPDFFRVDPSDITSIKLQK